MEGGQVARSTDVRTASALVRSFDACLSIAHIELLRLDIIGKRFTHLLCVRRRLAAFSRSACWTAHLSTSEFTRFCSSSLSFGDLGRGAGADLNSLLKFNPRKKSLSPSTIIKSSRACSRKRFVSSSFVSFG